MGNIISWNDNKIEKGYRIYRSLTPMDPSNLPDPITELPMNTTEYFDDHDILDDLYYRVSAFVNGEEKVSDEVKIANELDIMSKIFDGTVGGGWYTANKQYLYQDVAGTIPVSSHGDPVRFVLDRSGNENHLTSFPGSNAGVYQAVDDVEYIEFTGNSDLYVDFDSQVQYPFTISSSIDNRIVSSNGNNFNCINISDPTGDRELYAYYGFRSQLDGPGVAVYNQTFTDIGLSYGDDIFSIVGTFNDNEQYISVNSFDNTSSSISIPQPSNAYRLSYNSLRRYSSHYYGGSRLYSLAIAFTSISTIDEHQLHEFHKRFLPIG